MSFILAFCVTCVGLLPLYVSKKPIPAILLGVASLFVLWALFYAIVPSFAYPLWGAASLFCVVLMAVSLVIDSATGGGYEWEIPGTAIIPILGLALIFLRGCEGCNMVNAIALRDMLGKVEERDWTQDLQPADPKHIRLVPPDLAIYLADKQLGSVPGNLSSQFEIRDEELTIQLIHGELCYVVPLEFRNITVWSSVGTTPGYIKISAEDPRATPTVHTAESYAYMTGAFFDKNLERHLWEEGYRNFLISDETFEIDEDGKGWWVVSVMKPTLGYSGDIVLGVVIVNPTDGTHAFYPKDKTPDWVDRVMPESVVTGYIKWHGNLVQGWWNSFWGHQNTTHPGSLAITYGSDGQPYWVADIGSTNGSDNSILGLMYVNARTGAAHYYHTKGGGTYEAIVSAVNSAVKYKSWHAEHPVIYNLYGSLAAITPVLAENHTFQGVGIVRLDTSEVVFAENEQAALREYQKKIGIGGLTALPNTESRNAIREGTVDRFAMEIKGGDSTYYFHLDSDSHLFIGSSGLSPKLPLTKVGDKVTFSFIDANDLVVPILTFDNATLSLQAPAK